MSDARAPLRLRTATPTDEADRAVLARIADGELDALEELYDRYKTMAYSIAYRITNDATLAEDVVQDAFLGAWRNAARYVEGRGSVKTWLLAIVHHRAIDAIRRRRPTTELPEREAIPPPALTPARRLGRGRGRPRRRGGPRAPSPSCPTSSARRSSSPISVDSPSRRSRPERVRRSGRSRAACALASWPCAGTLTGDEGSAPDGHESGAHDRSHAPDQLTCDEVRESGGRVRPRRARSGRGGAVRSHLPRVRTRTRRSRRWGRCCRPSMRPSRSSSPRRP